PAHRQAAAGGVCAAEASRREGRGASPREARSSADEADAEAGRLSRSAGRRTVQVGSLSLLRLRTGAGRGLSPFSGGRESAPGMTSARPAEGDWSRADGIEIPTSSRREGRKAVYRRDSDSFSRVRQVCKTTSQ